MNKRKGGGEGGIEQEGRGQGGGGYREGGEGTGVGWGVKKEGRVCVFTRRRLGDRAVRLRPLSWLHCWIFLVLCSGASSASLTARAASSGRVLRCCRYYCGNITDILLPFSVTSRN